MAYPSLHARSKALPPIQQPSPSGPGRLSSFLGRRKSHALPLMQPMLSAYGYHHSQSPPDAPYDIEDSISLKHQRGMSRQESLGRSHSRMASSSTTDGVPIYLPGRFHEDTDGDDEDDESSYGCEDEHMTEDKQEFTVGQRSLSDLAPTPPLPPPPPLFTTNTLLPTVEIRTPRRTKHTVSFYPTPSTSHDESDETFFEPTSHKVNEQRLFSAIWLSSTSAPRSSVSNSTNKSDLTLIQLHVAGLIFVIPLVDINRYPSHLRDYVAQCVDSNEADQLANVQKGKTSDLTKGWEIDSDDEDMPRPQVHPITPPLNLRAESMNKLQKLGVLPITPPRRPTPPISSVSLRNQLSPSPTRAKTDPSRQMKNSSTIHFFNFLLLRSPDPYAAIAYFFTNNELLPSLRAILEGESAVGGCPLCGEAQRARKLREVEAEADWLGLQALVNICKKERRRSGFREEQKFAPNNKTGGWI